MGVGAGDLFIIYFNLLGKYIIAFVRRRRTSTPRKEARIANKKKKGRKGQRTKPPTPTRATGALIENKKQKERERARSGTPTQVPWTIHSPPTTRKDHSMSLFF